MADKNMEAQISVEFEEATSRQSLNSGETINTLWGKVKRWLTDLKTVAFSGSYKDLSDTPTTATTDTDGLMSAEDKGKLEWLLNPNLLINPDFKINQRGISGTFSEVDKYFVDRWKLVSGTVTVNSDGTITLNGRIEQVFETPPTLETPLTLETVLNYEAYFTVSSDGGSIGVSCYMERTSDKFIVKILSVVVEGSGDIISWTKLEAGASATPFIAPDPVEELRKCQRYYRVITNTMIQPYMYYTNLLLYFIPIKDMRDDGVAPTVTISGTINDFSGIVIYDYYGGTKVGDIDTIDASFPKGWGVYLNAHTVFNPSGLTGTLRIADGARVIVDAEIYQGGAT